MIDAKNEQGHRIDFICIITSINGFITHIPSSVVTFFNRLINLIQTMLNLMWITSRDDFNWIGKKKRSLIGTVFFKVKLYILLLIIVHHVFLLSYVPVYISFYYTFRHTLFLLSFCPWCEVVYNACKHPHGLAF